MEINTEDKVMALKTKETIRSKIYINSNVTN